MHVLLIRNDKTLGKGKCKKFNSIAYIDYITLFKRCCFIADLKLDNAVIWVIKDGSLFHNVQPK